MNPGIISGPPFINLEYFFNEFFKGVEFSAKKIYDFSLFLDDPLFQVFSALFSLLFVAGIIFVVYKIILLNKSRIIEFEEIFEKEGSVEGRVEHWDEIMRKIESENDSDWKVAIIEADALIDEILQKIGHEGDDLGERLKSIEPSDFDNLQNVWDAHKVRNRIAHDPKFKLTKREAQEIIRKYEKALKEFKYL